MMSVTFYCFTVVLASRVVDVPVAKVVVARAVVSGTVVVVGASVVVVDAVVVVACAAAVVGPTVVVVGSTVVVVSSTVVVGTTVVVVVTELVVVVGVTVVVSTAVVGCAVRHAASYIFATLQKNANKPTCFNPLSDILGINFIRLWRPTEHDNTIQLRLILVSIFSTQSTNDIGYREHAH